VIMKATKTFLKKILPSPIKLTRAHNRAKFENNRLLAMNVSLSEKHLGFTKVLPDRLSLLDLLPKNGTAAEVGVANGRFSKAILEHNHPQTLYLIDAWHMGSSSAYGDAGLVLVKRQLIKEIEAGVVKICRGMSWDMLEQLPNASLDWVYIDASHDYDSVKKDLNVAITKVKKNGLICGHDYVRWGRFGKRFGVLEAVNEFCLLYNYAIKYLTLESDYNWSYALQKVD
jgi:hypothetical protein